MNKILLNFLVVGVSLASIQGASGMDVEGDSQSNYKKKLRSSSACNKENINNFNGIQFKASGMDVEGDSQSNYKKRLRSSSARNKENINDFNNVQSKKSKTKNIKPSVSFERNSQNKPFRALLSEFDRVVEDPSTLFCHEYSSFSQEPNIQELTIDLQELDFLLATFYSSHTGA